MKDQGASIRTMLRASGALVLLAYVICHFADHILLLVSLPTAVAGHRILIDPWRSVPGTLLLAAGFFAHYGNALWSIYARRAFLLSRWGWWQLGLGLSIPLILAWHMADTRLQEHVTGVPGTYLSVLVRLWVLAPWRGMLQALVVVVVWTHACIGIHFWWRTKAWYAHWRLALAVFALLWPALALAGYVAAGGALARMAAQDPAFVPGVLGHAHLDADAMGESAAMAWRILIIHLALVSLAVAARQVRRWRELRRKPAMLTHANGRMIPVQPGATVLETLYEHGIRHASVCGGRARCTTCRVRVLDGAAALPVPSALEAQALARIAAPEGVRLACQLRPTADLTVVPLLPPSANPADGHGRAGFAGHEQVVTAMFVDLRGSTKLGEARMPYDVLFILGRFFSVMNDALRATGGYFAQFTGDGLLALYGLDGGDPTDAARAAVKGAAEMLARLEALNKHLGPELAQPLRIGIGMHHGEAIVGPLGPPGTQVLTAIGDNINIAARLESLSKQHNGAVIVSRRAADAAGLDLAGQTLHSAMLSGRAEPVEYYALMELPRFRS